MDTSPLPSRTRPSGDNARRNPFTIAKAASLSRANSSSLSSLSSLSTSSAKPKVKLQPQPQPQPMPDIDDDIEDSEDEANDELAGVGGLASSPYFTQPTQPVTQPTQILKKPPASLRRDNSQLPSSSSAPPLDTIPVSIASSSPLRPVPSVIEVPASSPMASLSASPRRAAPLSKLPQGRLAGRMAPVGTAYKSPARAAGNDSDDDPLDNIISINDSSEDDNDNERASRRARSDIRPSSFHRGGRLTLQTEPENDRPSKPSRKVPTEGAINILVRKARVMLEARKIKVDDADIRSALVAHNYKLKETVGTVFDEALKEEFVASEPKKSRTTTPIEVNKVPSMIRTSANNGKRDMIRGFAYNGNGNGNGSGTGTGTANTSRASTPATPSSQQSLKRGTVLDASPRPKRRRLVQGRKYREPSSPPPEVVAVKKTVAPKPNVAKTGKAAKTEKAGKTAKAKPIVIESDEEEEAEMTAEGSGEDEEDGEDGEEEDDEEDEEDEDEEGDDESGDERDSPGVPMDDADNDDDDVIDIDDDDDNDDATTYDVEKRVLEYFNTCTVDDLVAMLGAKARSRAETILSHRPFRTRASVTRIQTPETAGARGRKKKAANIGEDIFYEVEEYVVALRAIDEVVTQCEQKGLKIRAALNRWDVDSHGEKKGTLTPRSAGSPGDSPSEKTEKTETTEKTYTPLPIPREPKLMRGHCTMKGYQLYGLNWLWELYRRKFGCILADDMGLGKTCQVISFLSKVIEAYDEDGDEDGSKRPWPNLVVVPPSTLANWKVEFKKFAPDISVTTYSGSVAERAEIFEEIQDMRDTCHVVLTSYSQLSGKQDVDAMRKLRPNAAIFDEGHKMKNCNTAIYKSLRRIEAGWRLILTGTPVQNNLMEMINLLRFIQPHLFERHVDKLDALFSQRFTLQDVSNGALLFSDRVGRARSILEPFILQRRKEQVLASMPKKTSRVVYCDLDETQRPIYAAYEEQFRRGKDKSGKRKTKAAAATETAVVKRTAMTGLSSDQNNVWVQLRKSAIHAQLFRRYYDDKKVEQMAAILMAKVPQTELRQPDMGHLVSELRDCSDFELHTWCRDYKCLAAYDMPEGHFVRSGKVQQLLALIEEYERNGDRALVFSRFARVLNILREVMTFKGIRYVSLEGATRVEERQDIINEFTQTPEITVFLLTTGSGGTGINLTAANKVVIFDQSDNPQDDVQAENRAHRLGQAREVEVVKLVTRGTIEELVYKACQTKLELAERVTAGRASRAEVAAYEKMEREQGDGAAAVKAIEEEVRAMLQAGVGAGVDAGADADADAGADVRQDDKAITPPKSEDEEMGGD